MRLVYSLTRTLCGWLLLFFLPGLARDYHFDGSMPEEVLRSYLSRSMTTMYLLTSHGDFDDNLRMLTNCGVKFAGRAVYQWGREEGGESALPKKLELAKKNAARIHAADPELILQACILVNQPGAATPNGFGQEEAIRSIWASDNSKLICGNRHKSCVGPVI